MGEKKCQNNYIMVGVALVIRESLHIIVVTLLAIMWVKLEQRVNNLNKIVKLVITMRKELFKLDRIHKWEEESFKILCMAQINRFLIPTLKME